MKKILFVLSVFMAFAAMAENEISSQFEIQKKLRQLANSSCKNDRFFTDINLLAISGYRLMNIHLSNEKESIYQPTFRNRIDYTHTEDVELVFSGEEGLQFDKETRKSLGVGPVKITLKECTYQTSTVRYNNAGYNSFLMDF